MASLPRSHFQVHCVAAASCHPPSAWSALWWYGTQQLYPPLSHKHMHVTPHLSHFKQYRLHFSDIFNTIACMTFSPYASHYHLLVFHIKIRAMTDEQNLQSHQSHAEKHPLMPFAFTGGNTSSHIQIIQSAHHLTWFLPPLLCFRHSAPEKCT